MVLGRASDLSNLSDSYLNEIIRSDWFEPACNRNAILINADQLSDKCANYCCFSPSDCGIVIDDNIRIDDCLKRWNDADGFYHAKFFHV